MAEQEKDAASTDLKTQISRVARGLESAGYYNAAKLLWAAEFSLATRESNRQDIPVTDQDLLDELEAIEKKLAATDIDATLVTAIDIGKKGIRENRPIHHAEIPEVQVCRSCGAIYLGKPPDTCSKCNAASITMRTFPPIYFLEPLHPQQVMDALASAPDELETMLRGLSNAQLAKPARPGQWSIRDILQHIFNSQGLLSGRVSRMLAEDNPSLEGVATWAMYGDQSLPASELLDQFQILRQSLVERLRKMTANEWWRTASHSEYGQVTILQQASYFAKHEREHWQQIFEIRQALGVSPTQPSE